MSYLERLRDLVESETRAGMETSKPTKGAFVDFEGTPPGPSSEMRDEIRYWRWLVRYPDGSGFEARTLPIATRAEARKLWPGAQVESLPDVDSAKATE